MMYCSLLVVTIVVIVQYTVLGVVNEQRQAMPTVYI